MFIVAFLFLFAALGPQVVLSSSFRFNFSTVEQCAPVQIFFFGNDASDRIPSSLLILPFNSTPFSIPIPDATSNSTGVNLSFLPLTAGTQFIASLDDAGDNVARVSDVFIVEPSPTGDSSCLPPAPASRPFIIPTSVSQCQPFSVGYQTSAPSVRAFLPNFGAFSLDLETDVPEEMRAIYVLNVTHGLPVLLMAFPQDDPSAGVTSPLLTVGGEATSNTTCFNFKSKTKQSSPPGLSKGLIIGLAVGGGLVFLLTLMMIIYIIHQRRQRRLAFQRTSPLSPDLLEKRGSEKTDFPQSLGFVPYEAYGQRQISLPSPGSQKPLPLSPGYALRYESGFVKDPPYTTQKFSPTSSEFDEPTPISWMADPAVATQISRVTSMKATIRSAKTASSINPYDIEQMLDEAADNPIPSPKPLAKEGSPALSSLSIPRQLPARGHLRSPDDVPSAMASYSNIFENSPIHDSPQSMSSRFSMASSSNFEILTRPVNGFVVGDGTRLGEMSTSSGNATKNVGPGRAW